jgi:uncharacterized phage infection (PIP) family protein YhgE
MRRKIVYGAFVLMLALLLGISGMTAGARLEVWRAQEQQAFVEAQSAAIAILSMDVGTYYDDRDVVFAEDIIASLPATYTLVSKEVGEKGLAEGSYGALITFPADFSQRLTTINSARPLAAQFSYKLNMNLSEDSLLVVMTNILKLEREVNDRLSYMFISSVFEEFHDAQKRVSAVLANDMADIQALSEVQSMDLVAKLQLTTLPQDIPEFRAADISEFTNDNLSIMTEMNESYQEYLQLAMDEAKALSEETDNAVNDEEAGLASFTKSIDALTWLPETEGKGDSFTYIGATASAAITAVSDALSGPQMDVPALEAAIAAVRPDTTSTTEEYNPYTDVESGFAVFMESLQVESPEYYAMIDNALNQVMANSLAIGHEEGVRDAWGNADVLLGDIVDQVDSFNTNVTEAYTGIRTSLAEVDQSIGDLTEGERAAMEAYGTEQIASLNATFAEKKALMQEIATKMAAYDPLHHITDNQEVFAEYATRFQDNVSGIQTEVSEQVTHDNEQLNKLYQDHAEYIEVLKEDIQETKDEGDQLLEDAMQVFYDAKMNTSASNVENMQEFAEKLPNSRLGNLGNNNLFNFIASPIASIDSDPLARPSLPQQIRRIDFLHENTILYLIGGAAILMLLALVSFFAATTIQDYRARKQYEEDLTIPREAAHGV